jgi:anti-sigma-K factor RskA
MSAEMTCQAVDELAGAHALGALEHDEEEAVARHLASCDEPHVELRAAIGVGETLAMSVEPVPPTAALRDRLMATIERMPQGHRPAAAPAATPASERAARAGWLSWLSPRVARPMALAAVVALLALGGWNLSLQSQLAQRDAALRAVAAAIADGQAAFRVEGSAGRGYVVDTPGAGAALVVADLQGLPAGRLYELWLIDAAGTPVAVGTFSPSDGAVAVISVERDLGGFTTFAVTVEAERVAAPSSSPVMVGDLTAG